MLWCRPAGLAGAAFLAVFAALAGCAPHPASPAAEGDAASRAEPIRAGMIVSIRPAALQASNASGASATILRAVGAPDDAPDPPAAGACEFIIHQDDGQIVSVVQTNASSLVAGERVTLSPGPPIRIAPAATGT